MPQILIVSDTHKNYDLLHKVLAKNATCEYLIHLGDEPDDLNYFLEFTAKMQIFSVYGIYHRQWTPQTATLSFDIAGLHFHIAHAQEHLKTPQLKQGGVIHCFGHTHHRYFIQDGLDIYLNPGHLKAEKDRGETAGYAIIDTTPDPILTFYDHTHKPLSTNHLPT